MSVHSCIISAAGSFAFICGISLFCLPYLHFSRIYTSCKNSNFYFIKALQVQKNSFDLSHNKVKAQLQVKRFLNRAVGLPVSAWSETYKRENPAPVSPIGNILDRLLAVVGSYADPYVRNVAL